MKIFEAINETKLHLADVRLNNKSIGFIPTMGALHEGHLSLINTAKLENDYVVCSIFVNPIQFNNQDDLKNYPRNPVRDIEMLETAGCDFLFHPSVNEMYPEPVHEVFDFGGLEKVMEGVFRPGHFNGVAVVVKKLFEIITPHRAYFGLKDFQQLAIIQKMVRDFNIPVEIVPCPTVREEDELAMSSRNQLLSIDDRRKSVIIYQTLKEVKTMAGNASVSDIKNYVISIFHEIKNARLEYFEIVDMYSLEPISTWEESRHVVACIAVYFGNVRLIDNIILFS